VRLRPYIRYDHHAPQRPRRPRDRHLRWPTCLPKDPKPLTAALTQGRSVNIRHASRGVLSFRTYGAEQARFCLWLDRDLR
jgi:hypothetical protein